MKTKLILLLGLLGIAGVAWADTEAVERNQTARPIHFVKGFYVGNDASLVVNNTLNKVSRVMGRSATVDFASTLAGRVESSAITVPGARAGDPCFVGTTTAAGALAAQYTCYVSATNAVKIVFAPLSRQVGTTMLDGGSPSQIDVTGITASSKCNCTPVGTTAAIAAGGCAASLDAGTLTMTSANTLTNNVNYECVAPVDPASGTFYVFVVSSQ